MSKCISCGENIVWGKFAGKEELGSKFCLKCLSKPFPITSVCRVDLLQSGFTHKQIAKMDDGDMKRLAEKMSGAYTDNCFWIDIEIIAESILDDKK
ncbi:MAG: hypothetical protein PHQ00_05440 [Phycisphaerae bacterium]|nr:hypothetical protein [Phycisphaerae bacterium]